MASMLPPCKHFYYPCCDCCPWPDQALCALRAGHPIMAFDIAVWQGHSVCSAEDGFGLCAHVVSTRNCDMVRAIRWVGLQLWFADALVKTQPAEDELRWLFSPDGGGLHPDALLMDAIDVFGFVHVPWDLLDVLAAAGARFTDVVRVRAIYRLEDAPDETMWRMVDRGILDEPLPHRDEPLPDEPPRKHDEPARQPDADADWYVAALAAVERGHLRTARDTLLLNRNRLPALFDCRPYTDCSRLFHAIMARMDRYMLDGMQWAGLDTAQHMIDALKDAGRRHAGEAEGPWMIGTYDPVKPPSAGSDVPWRLVSGSEGKPWLFSADGGGFDPDRLLTSLLKRVGFMGISHTTAAYLADCGAKLADQDMAVAVFQSEVRGWYTDDDDDPVTADTLCGMRSLVERGIMEKRPPMPELPPPNPYRMNARCSPEQPPVASDDLDLFWISPPDAAGL
jgi:hypothetical protein